MDKCLTLDDLRAWWVAHPDARAVPGNPIACLVAVAADGIYGGIASEYAPGEPTVEVWQSGRAEFMFVPVGEGVENAALIFDCFDVEHDVDSAACVAVIDKVIEQMRGEHHVR